MKTFRLLVLLVTLGSSAVQIDPCATGETPCDRNRPWQRGTTEKSCALPREIERLRKEFPGRIINPCECKHMCDPNDPHAGTTDDRKWDAKCEARCSPRNCRCPHPCDGAH